MKRILCTANFLLFAALGMQACDKQPELTKNPVKSFFNELRKKVKSVKNRFQPKKQLVIIIPAEPQNSTQQEVGKSNALNTNTSEPQFKMFADMPEEIIKDHIMTNLDDKSFLRFARACKQLGALAKTGFNQRFEQNKQEQREIFKKKIVENGRKLDLRKMNLKTIYPGVFYSIEFEKLEWLMLRSNNLKKIDKGTFKGLPNLHYLYLNDNRLADLHKDIFQDSKKLILIWLSGNQLTQKSINSDIFKGLKNLENLDLRSNNLSELHNDTFNELERLNILELSNNKLKHLDKKILYNLYNLKYLVLYDNPLTHKNVNELIKFKKHQKKPSKISSEPHPHQSTFHTDHPLGNRNAETGLVINLQEHFIETLGVEIDFSDSSFDDSEDDSTDNFTCEFDN